ncbi:MAG: hypothetical protein LBT05_08330 [Planctomycetaceae bacterium]|nr:hypothetical protein [Planctomycetaceae bacterium]
MNKDQNVKQKLYASRWIDLLPQTCSSRNMFSLFGRALLMHGSRLVTLS